MGDKKGDGFDMRDVMKREKAEKKKSKKGKKKAAELEGAQEDFEINVNDPRFAALHESHHFAIDPNNPQFKKTKSMQKLMNSRQEKIKGDNLDAEWKKSTPATVSGHTMIYLWIWYLIVMHRRRPSRSKRMALNHPRRKRKTHPLVNLLHLSNVKVPMHPAIPANDKNPHSSIHNIFPSLSYIRSIYITHTHTYTHMSVI